MPIFNRRGDAVMGVGAGTISVNGVPLLGAASQACWLNDLTVLANAQAPSGNWRIVRIDVATGVVNEHAAVGANALAAGGNEWIAWNSADGVFGSFPPQPAAGLRGAGLDGTLAYCRNYQLGLGLVLHAPSGAELDVPGVIVYDLQVIGPTAALWYDGGGHGVVGIPAPRPALPAGRLRRVVVEGEAWLVYWHNVADTDSLGLIAQVDGATDGYVLHPDPTAFNHDAVAVGNSLYVAWSRTQGEAPSDLTRLIVDRTHPRRPLVVAPPDPIDPPDPPDPIDPPDPPDPIDPPDPPDGGVDMSPQPVAIRGMAGKLARIDPSELGRGPFGGYPIHWDRDTVGPHETFELSKPDGKYQITHVETGVMLGADATQYAANICEQFYTSGGAVQTRGPYESWIVFRLVAGGTICALIEYDQDGVIYTSSDLNLEEL